MLNEKQRKNIKSKYWRLNHLYKIVDKKGQTVVFKFNAHQNRIWQECVDEKGNLTCDPLILKSRQIGMTTFFLLFYLDDIIFTKNITAGIISHSQDSLEKIFEKVRFAYENLPEWCKPELDRGGGSKYEMKFPELNSKIYTDLYVRSETLHRLHISEFAFAQLGRILATIGALPPETRHSIESTANGMNHFHDEWVNPESRYKKFFFPWFEHSEYALANVDTGPLQIDEIKLCLTKEQAEFRRSKKQQLKNLFRQEYPESDIDCFISSGAGFFDSLDIAECQKAAKKEVDVFDFLNEKSGKYFSVHLFEKPVISERYLISVDVSEGISAGDFSFVSCWRRSTRTEVGFMQERLSTFDLAHLLAALGKFYNNAELVVERNNHGHAVLQELDKNLKYSNIFSYTEGRIGWLTDKITKPLMLDTLDTGVRNRTLCVNNPIFFSEALTFVENNGSFGALEGYHDDSVMALGIAAQRLSTVTHGNLPKPGPAKKPMSQGLKSKNW